MIGKVIKNNYKIIDEIGRGSVAAVYLATEDIITLPALGALIGQVGQKGL